MTHYYGTGNIRLSGNQLILEPYYVSLAALSCRFIVRFRELIRLRRFYSFVMNKLRGILAHLVAVYYSSGSEETAVRINMDFSRVRGI